MMLRYSSSGDLGHKNLQNPVRNRSFSPCNFQGICSHSNTGFFSLEFPRETVVYPGFKLHYQSRAKRTGGSLLPFPSFETERNHDGTIDTYPRKQNCRGGTWDSRGFKLHCYTNTSVSRTNTSHSGRRKKYGGSLFSILRSLETESDVDKALNSWVGKLSAKEQTIILKEQSDWERALCVFRWMKSQKDYLPNVIHYNIVLRALGRAQKWDELRLCWIEMAREGVFPTNNTYGMLIDVYGKAGLAKEALLWLRHMRLRGVFPDEITMNTVVWVLKDAGEFDRADSFFKDWCNGQVKLDDLDFDYIADSGSGSGPISLKQFLSTELFKAGGRNPPTKALTSTIMEGPVQKPRLAATYNTLIDLYGKAGRLKDATNAFREMLKSGVAPDTFTFNTMIFICGTHGNLSEAESLFSKMQERGIAVDTKTYNIFLSLYADAGNIGAALDCYRKIREVGLFPDTVTHRAILHILCQRNLLEEVDFVIKEMDSSGVCIDEHSLPVVIRMYVNNGMVDEAKIILEKCQLSACISSRTYAAVIDAFADQDLWTEAEAVFYRKRDFIGHKKDVVEYNVMIKAYGRAKLYDKAFSLFKVMRSNGSWPDECTYNSLIQMYSGADLVDQAMDLLAEMQGAGFKPSCQTFSSVIAGNARLGQLSNAVKIYQEMERVGVKPNEVVYGSLVNGFAEAGKVEEALHYFHMMEEFGILANQIVLTSLIKAYGKVGCLEGAEELFEKMKHLEGGPDIVASNSMINLYAGLGMLSEAKLIFNYLREKGQADGVSFATMMYLFKSMGMLDEAIDVAREMQHSGLLRDCASFNTVMTSFATNGQLRECGELLHEMITQKILPNEGTFKVMFTVLKKGRVPVEAVNQMELSSKEGKPYARQAVITSVFSAVGLHDYALESCDVFTKADVALDTFAYNIAIYAYGASGEVEKALNMFMKMQDHGMEPDLVTSIHLVGCYGKAGIIEGVKRIYSRLKYGEIEPNKSLFKAVIDAYRIANRHDLAELVSQEMRFTSDTQEDPDCQSEDESDGDLIHFSGPLEHTDL